MRISQKYNYLHKIDQTNAKITIIILIQIGMIFCIVANRRAAMLIGHTQYPKTQIVWKKDLKKFYF